MSTTTSRNEAAERLRDNLQRGQGWPDELLRDLDAALSEERRLERERIRERLVGAQYQYDTPDDKDPVRAILDEVAR